MLTSSLRLIEIFTCSVYIRFSNGVATRPETVVESCVSEFSFISSVVVNRCPFNGDLSFWNKKKKCLPAGGQVERIRWTRKNMRYDFSSENHESTVMSQIKNGLLANGDAIVFLISRVILQGTNLTRTHRNVAIFSVRKPSSYFMRT